jgi:hypothetical protein
VLLRQAVDHGTHQRTALLMYRVGSRDLACGAAVWSKGIVSECGGEQWAEAKASQGQDWPSKRNVTAGKVVRVFLPLESQ